MNHFTKIQDASACLRQFQASPAGCSADQIASAEGLSLERCQDVLSQLEQAHLVEPIYTPGEARYRLADTVTALDILNAVWQRAASESCLVLYMASPEAAEILRTLGGGQWAQG